MEEGVREEAGSTGTAAGSLPPLRSESSWYSFFMQMADGESVIRRAGVCGMPGGVIQ